MQQQQQPHRNETAKLASQAARSDDEPAAPAKRASNISRNKKTGKKQPEVWMLSFLHQSLIEYALANAINVLQACIHKSVETGLFFKLTCGHN